MAPTAPNHGASVLRLLGENDAVVVPLKSDIDTAVDAAEPVIVDLTGVTSIDAATLRVLLEGLAECESRERTFLLLLPANEDSPLTRLFRVAGLHGLLPVVSSWDEAFERAGVAQADAPG